MIFLITDQGVIQDSEYSLEVFNSDQSVYEVIRIIDRVALFLEDHFKRLHKSMEIPGIPFDMEYLEFKDTIAELVRINHKQEGNIKFVYSRTGNGNHWAFVFVPHSYPTPEEYKNGVTTNLLFAGRINPNAKVIQNTVRENANQLIADQKLHEVLLVDSNGLITEGSRSNVFFVKDEVFYTAPSSKVLEGITRQQVFWCFAELSFPVIEEAVNVDEISRFDSVFLTGTSPGILPVRSIGNQVYTTQLSCVKKLTNCYNDLVARYIQNEKSS